jgi:hypothetical protein
MQNFNPSAFSKPQLKHRIGVSAPKASPNISGGAKGVPETNRRKGRLWNRID